MLFIAQSEDASHGMLGTNNKYDQEANKPIDKVRCYANALPAALPFPQTAEKKEGLYFGPWQYFGYLACIHTLFFFFPGLYLA